MGNPFINIGQAKTYVETPGNSAGNYWFDLGTSAPFQTQVDANGWVLVLDDFENQAAGALLQSTDLTAIASGSSGILSSATFGEMGGMDQVRIRTFNGGGTLLSDVMNIDAGIVTRVQSFQAIDQGIGDNGQADWTDLSGSNANLASYNLAATATTGAGNTDLDHRVFHTSGTSSGFHWLPLFSNGGQFRYHDANGGQFARAQLFVRDDSGAPLAPPSITVNNPSSDCFNDEVFTYSSTDAGRNIYTGAGFEGMNFGRIIYIPDATDGAWFIQTSVDQINWTDQFSNTSDSAPNPPTLGTGDGWTASTFGASTCGGVTRFDGTGTQNGNLILPVTLNAFTGKFASNQVTLDWETAAELNNEGFEVERSTDGRNFYAIDFVKGNGTIETASAYNFVDADLPKSVQTLYYRLKQLDMDGGFHYSAVVSVAVSSQHTVGTLSPNPTSSELYLTLENAVNTQIEIYDLAGRLVLSVPVETQTQLTLDVANLEAGMYLLRVGTETHRFVKR